MNRDYDAITNVVITVVISHCVHMGSVCGFSNKSPPVPRVGDNRNLINEPLSRGSEITQGTLVGSPVVASNGKLGQSSCFQINEWCLPQKSIFEVL